MQSASIQGKFISVLVSLAIVMDCFTLLSQRKSKALRLTLHSDNSQLVTCVEGVHHSSYHDDYRAAKSILEGKIKFYDWNSSICAILRKISRKVLYAIVYILQDLSV